MLLNCTAGATLQNITVSPAFFATEGITTVRVEFIPSLTLPQSTRNISQTLCRISPAPGGNTFGVPVKEALNGVFSFPAFERTSSGLACMPPKAIAEGPALLSVSLDGGQHWSSEAMVEYFNIFEVALDKRPYVHESSGQLLIRASQSYFQNETSFEVTANLQSIGKTWSWSEVSSTGKLGTGEIVLDMPFDVGMLRSLHTDITITISTPTIPGKTVTFEKRFHRVPPPTSVEVEIVQVNHATRSLDVNGLPYQGNGFYVGSFPNVTSNVSSLIDMWVSQNINQAMIYGLAEFPPQLQLDIFEIAAARGFKILYQLGTGAVQVNHGGPFNRSSLLDEMIANITLVKDQKALLGYYICDDCCSTQIDVSMQAQAYNIIKNIDPYHATVGAVNCEDTWTFSDVPSYLDSEIPKNSKTQPNGKQPNLQLSLDYFMQENYDRPLLDHSNVGGGWAKSKDGSLAEVSIFKDGVFRHGVPFEVVVNCPPMTYPTVSHYVPHYQNTYSWIGLIAAGMQDQLVFDFDVQGLYDTDRHGLHSFGSYWTQTGLYGLAAQGMKSSILAPFGTAIHPTIEIYSEDSSSVIGRAWAAIEGLKRNPKYCYHVVIASTKEDGPTTFTVSVNLSESGSPSLNGLNASRVFDAFYSIPIKHNMFSDMICSGCVNLYQIGPACEPFVATVGAR
jgi:hypothetical protein